MTAFTSSDEVTRIELVTVQNLLNTTGKAIYLNAMIEAAKKLGFSESQAELLVGQTFMGSVHLENRNNLSCKDWIAKVSSKGGTTEAAIKKFDNNAVHDHIIKGLEAAHYRAIELGKK